MAAKSLRLAYHTDESGRGEIMIKPFPSGGGKWQASVNGGDWPNWGPKGDRLFFTSDGKFLD